MNFKIRNKEISWLSFNERVLQEADSPDVPLVDRFKFLGICSSNLDEFYRVRVATLNRLTYLGKKAKKFIGEDPSSILKEITDIALKQHIKFDSILKKLIKALSKENIYIISEKELTPTLGEFVLNYFHSEVRPKLIPIMLNQVKDDLQLRDRTIYLSVCLCKNSDPSKKEYALIEIPSDVLPRFLTLPTIAGKKYIILLDDVIRYGLNQIFSIFAFDRYEAYTIKITRDAELDIDDDISESYMEKLHKSLKQRQAGNPVRFIYDSMIPDDLLKLLKEKLNLTKEDTLIAGSKYHNNRDFMNFPATGSRVHNYLPIKSLSHKDIHPEKSLLKSIRKKDILLHYPYQSFDYVIDLLREASIDPKVISIKMTLYRVAKNSSVLNALINAVKNGKSVVAVLELQARFDEESNIYWANRLQEEGVKVIFGVPGLKVHSKLCLVSRTEKSGIVHYAIIGTGNFNEDTARLYTDHALFTANKNITREVNKIFNFFLKTYRSDTFKHLIVSPNFMRKRMNRMINKEIKNAELGKPAHIFLKLNGLTDPQLIQKLYEASEAGVKIRLIVRGMFSLIPGIEGMSSNIEAISIVDKFLEHTRIFIFGNNGEEKVYISSADWMPRNIDLRIEVTCPIYDEDIKNELRTYMEIQWNDNVRARILNDKLDNKFRTDRSKKKIRTQWQIYEHLKKYHTNFKTV
jgi:polyphosphate kinase